MLLRVVIGSVYAEAEIGTKGQLISPEYVDTLLNIVCRSAVKNFWKYVDRSTDHAVESST